MLILHALEQRGKKFDFFFFVIYWLLHIHFIMRST